MSRHLLLIAAGVVALNAQTPVEGPSLGFVFDAPGQALRPILGIPGAAVFGDAMQPSAAIGSASLSMRHTVAVVNDGAWKAVTLAGSGAGNVVVLPDGLPASAQVTVSETGTAAAFYDATNGALALVTGIPSSMAVVPVSLDPLPGAITALAIGDDGALLLSSAVAGGGETLFWIGADGSVRQLASLQATASIVLWNQDGNALVTDRGGNQVWQIQAPGGNAAITLLASDADGVASPAGAALSPDGQQLWIANAGNRAVLGINIGTRASVSLPCGFDLTGMLPLADSLSFRLNDVNSGAVWILDTAPGAGPRVVFIPGIQRAATTTQEAAQ